jgi:hypothetical protein
MVDVWQEVIGEEHKEICPECDVEVMARDRPTTWGSVDEPKTRIICIKCYEKGSMRRKLRSAVMKKLGGGR